MPKIARLCGFIYHAVGLISFGAKSSDCDFQKQKIKNRRISKMKKIYLKNAQGIKVTVEVTDEVAAEYRKCLREEWNTEAYANNHTVSLENVMDLGMDFADEQPNAEEQLIENCERGQRKILLKRVKTVFPLLTELQRKTLHKLFVLNMTQAEIARDERISEQAVSDRLIRLYSKLRQLIIKN